MTPILLIDDHALFCSGVAMVLMAGLPNVTVHQAISLEQALQLDAVQPALVLLDVQLQGISGLEGIALLRRKWLGVKIVMLSAFDVSDVIKEAGERGAQDFISKTEKPERMLKRVAALLAGQASVDQQLAPSSFDRPKLTPRQFEVLDLLCQGMSNKVIARQMNLSEYTVRAHVQATLASLRVGSRSEAAFAARRLGLAR